MLLTVYGISNCDKVKTIRSWLQENNINYKFHDYKKHGCDEILVKNILIQFNFREVINTRGTTWRKLPDTIKNSLNDKKAAYLMRDNPSIIKRPILEFNGQWILGLDTNTLVKMLEYHPHA
tara:strand:- start:49 stop:411 length:363 start_codon:yes stop_codon:yes gene_type:complete